MIISITTISSTLKAQNKSYNKLYQFGIADAFVNGLYNAKLPLKDLKANGDFGVGAPGMLDGEITIYKGKVYQTKSTGVTAVAADSVNTALAFVTFFKADTVFSINKTINQLELYKLLDTYMTNKNGMYAIRVTGDFVQMKTRAFPPVSKEPYPALATIMDQMKTFELNKTKGVLIGYRIPPYLAGVNIAGYHFHYLNDALNAGGHALNFTLTNVKVEIANLTEFRLEVPKDKAFMNYDFKNTNKPEMDKVEKGH